jgi:hypothetical protein
MSRRRGKVMHWTMTFMELVHALHVPIFIFFALSQFLLKAEDILLFSEFAVAPIEGKSSPF